MFDFSRFLDVGDVLAQVDDEAYVRSAIGRYYYAIFCSVCVYLVEIMNENEFNDNYNVHQRIYNRLVKSGNNTESSVGEKLNDLRKNRNEADYDWKNNDFQYFKDKLDQSKKESKFAIEQVESLKKSPPFEF